MDRKIKLLDENGNVSAKGIVALTSLTIGTAAVIKLGGNLFGAAYDKIAKKRLEKKKKEEQNKKTEEKKENK